MTISDSIIFTLLTGITALQRSCKISGESTLTEEKVNTSACRLQIFAPVK